MILNFVTLMLNLIFDYLRFLLFSYMFDAWIKIPSRQCHQTTVYLYASPHLEKSHCVAGVIVPTVWSYQSADLGSPSLLRYWIFASVFYSVDSFVLPTLISDIAEPSRLVFLLSYQLLNFQLHFLSTNIASNVSRSSLLIFIGVALTSNFAQSFTDSDWHSSDQFY